jgi:hypothetical protein
MIFFIAVRIRLWLSPSPSKTDTRRLDPEGTDGFAWFRGPLPQGPVILEFPACELLALGLLP